MTKPRLYFTNQTIDRKMAREAELRIEAATGLELENPFYDGEAKEVAELDTKGTTNLTADEICGMDLRKIRHCKDGILALMSNDKDIGSCMEIAIAAHSWGRDVYVIAVTPQHYNHPWIKYFATEVFATVDEFIEYANKTWSVKHEVKDSAKA